MMRSERAALVAAAWLTLVVAGLVLATAGLGASLIPARRAVRIDPMVALREQ